MLAHQVNQKRINKFLKFTCTLITLIGVKLITEKTLPYFYS